MGLKFLSEDDVDAVNTAGVCNDLSLYFQVNQSCCMPQKPFPNWKQEPRRWEVAIKVFSKEREARKGKGRKRNDPTSGVTVTSNSCGYDRHGWTRYPTATLKWKIQDRKKQVKPNWTVGLFWNWNACPCFASVTINVSSHTTCESEASIQF